MANEINELQATIQQNELLREQCELLREQNKLLRRAASVPTGEREVYIDNLDDDEMRNGSLVTSHRKKLWNVQIGLLKEFDRICKKHNLQWFAIGGTLLGAARHGGFIPWDFDVDVIMFRPEYEKFRRIAAEEVKEPYFADGWYDYLLESEGAKLEDVKGNVQFVTKTQEKTRPLMWLTQWPSIRLRDNRTTMIETPDRDFVNQGIWIDIFPLDSLPPFLDKKSALNFEVAKILLLATAAPAQIRRIMAAKKNLLLDYKILKNFLSKTYSERGEQFDNFMNRKFVITERVGDIRDYCLTGNQKFYHSKDFRDIVYLPFEKIEVPAPIGYESVLTDFYGDWRKPVIYPPHMFFHSADIPYKEFFRENIFK